MAKSATLTLRIEPALKHALQEAAALEHRSIANMVEHLIRQHCLHKDIAIQEQNNQDSSGEPNR